MCPRMLMVAALAVGLAVAGCGDDADDADDGGFDAAICQPDQGSFTLEIDNDYFPLPVGLELVLEGDDEGTSVRVEITVLDETEEVAGVTCRVVEEAEYEDDEVVEISRNFFVQAPDGTVCYYGEDVDMYQNGEVVSHGGAWRAGENGALPGIIMPAQPTVGMSYDQEVAPGVAEDHGEITAMGEHVSVPAGEFDDTIRVRETSPLDSGSSLKLYIRDIGMAVDDEIELISS